MFMLLKDYLTDRLQFTACDNTCSTCNQVLCGVPQGSTLGPLLFILYINDLPEHTNFNVRMFADDTVLFIKSKKLHELESIVTSELHKISEWTKFNRLSLNLNKTTYMIIYNSKNKNKEKCFKIRLCENDIKQSQKIKYLGLNLQSNLKSNDHLNYVYKKVSQAAGIISKIRHYVNKKTLLMMYYYFLYRHLQYGILTWANTNKSVIKPLKTLQNHILRLMSYKKLKDKINLNKLYLFFDILKLEDIFVLEMAKFMYQYHNNTLPELFQNYFKRSSECHKYSTRSATNQKLFVPRVNTTHGQLSCLYTGVKIWNNLHLEIWSLSYVSFKKELRKMLMAKYEQK